MNLTKPFELECPKYWVWIFSSWLSIWKTQQVFIQLLYLSSRQQEYVWNLQARDVSGACRRQDMTGKVSCRHPMFMFTANWHRRRLLSPKAYKTQSMVIHSLLKIGVTLLPPCHRAPPAACHPPSAASAGPAPDGQNACRPGRRSWVWSPTASLDTNCGSCLWMSWGKRNHSISWQKQKQRKCFNSCFSHFIDKRLRK